MIDRDCEQALHELKTVFDRIPRRGPVQDESKMAEPDEVEVMRQIESGKHRSAG